MVYTVDYIKSVIGNAHTEKQIEKALSNIPHERDTDGYDYYNIDLLCLQRHYHRSLLDSRSVCEGVCNGRYS